eukprot:CAMPEP_0197532048 /NCGR_PEP_ID=MMETSP1318-20131121/38290_1 /TAXON_ID=552666 /ORGANISM="Partenskyella glossopodia, Strain RCC365" /LENGTH=94 /DNA_ID=CAMNT_0043088489 /DNA_START=186 /DNA_END=470 /DNA_ORIENTATION=+
MRGNRGLGQGGEAEIARVTGGLGLEIDAFEETVLKKVDRQRKELERKLDDYHLISAEGRWINYNNNNKSDDDNGNLDESSSSDEHDASSSAHST